MKRILDFLNCLKRFFHHCITVDIKQSLIYDFSEEYTIELAEESLIVCGGGH